MATFSTRKLNFLDALFGFVLHPSDTTSELMERDFPPYTLGCIFSLAATIFTPIIAQSYKRDMGDSQADYIAGFALVFLLTLSIFVLLELIMLRVLRYDAPTSKIVAVCCYAAAPLVPLLLVYYGVNLYSTGRLTVVGFFLTGVQAHDDHVVKFLPWFLCVAKLSVLLTFISGLRSISQQSLSSAIVVGAISAVPFYTALVIATCIAQARYPGSARVVNEVLVLFTQLF